MKKSIFTACFLFAGLSLFAQWQPLNPFKKASPDKHQKLVQALLNTQSTLHGAALKPTEMRQRVIAQTNIDEGDVEDTCTFKYSGTRGSKYDHNNLSLSYSFYFQSDYLPVVQDKYETPSLNLLADSIISYSDGNISGISKAYYRNDNKTDSFFNYYYGGPNTVTEKTFHRFNSQNYLTSVTNINDFVGAFDTGSLTKYFYNTAQNQLVSDTIYQQETNGLAPYFATKYHYNAQNLLDSISFYYEDGTPYTLSEQTKIEYTGNNLLQRIITWNYDNTTGALESLEIDSFGYTGSLPIYTFYQEQFISADLTDTFSNQLIKYLNSDDLPDSAQSRYYENGAWVNDIKMQYTYNNFKNPTVIKGINPNGSIAGQFNFYYETYDDGNNVGIKDVAKNKTLFAYPNPFGEAIHIAWNNAQAQVKISLVNTIGQTIFTANKYLTTGDNSIDLPGVSDGNYILLLQDEKGNTYNSKLSKR